MIHSFSELIHFYEIWVVFCLVEIESTQYFINNMYFVKSCGLLNMIWHLGCALGSAGWLQIHKGYCYKYTKDTAFEKKY